MQAEGGGYEHPHSDTCPLDSLYIQTRVITAWNARTPAPDVSGLVQALREAGMALAWSSRRMGGADAKAALLASTRALQTARAELAKWERR